MDRQQFPTEDEKAEFVRLQLEVELLLDLPDESDPEGATGPTDHYFALGRQWVRYFFTGSYFTVREYMRPTVRPYADLTLDYPACVAGMANLLAELTTLNETELAKAADGVFRARRHARQQVTGSPSNRRRQRNQTGTRPADVVSGAAGPIGRPHDRQFPLRLHAAADGIAALRPTDVDSRSPAADAADAPKIRLVAQAWAVYFVTGLAHEMGGTQGDAMAAIADPNTSPEECVAGLGRVRDRLARLTPAERAAAFRHIDAAFHRYVPEFNFAVG